MLSSTKPRDEWRKPYHDRNGMR